MASKKAEGMLSPLLVSDDESSTGSDTDADSDASTKMETERQTPMQKLKALVVYGVLGAGVAGSAAAMVFMPGVAMFIAGGVCCANVPFAAIKERQISKTPTLRAMNNRLREDAGNLEDEVDILSEEIDILQPEADRAASVTEELQAIADKQQVNVDKLVALVKENEQILGQMRENLRQRIVQDIISIVVKSDRDNDSTIDKKEAKTLALRIRLSLQEYGVVFDSEKFLKVIGDTPSVPSVIAIVQKLLPSGKKEVEESDDDESDDSDSDEDSDEEDDEYDMFYMAEDDENGRVSLLSCDKGKSKQRGSAILLKKMHH